MKIASRKQRITLLLVLAALASITGTIVGAIQAGVHGSSFASQLPAFKIATARAALIARYVFHAFQALGIDGFWTLISALGVGIFLNNALVALVIAFAPPLILLAKPFSGKYLAKIYYKHGIWLFKPIGWKVYRILAAVLPIYGLGLQFYLIGGVALTCSSILLKAVFLPLEVASITALCIIAITPALLENPSRDLTKYFDLLKKSLPIVLLMLFMAALLEAYSLLAT